MHHGLKRFHVLLVPCNNSMGASRGGYENALFMKKQIIFATKKEIAIVVPKGLIGDDRRYIIVGNDGVFITFRKVLQEMPFYYVRIKEVKSKKWLEIMKEKRWFTKEVEDVVNELL